MEGTILTPFSHFDTVRNIETFIWIYASERPGIFSLNACNYQRVYSMRFIHLLELAFDWNLNCILTVNVILHVITLSLRNWVFKLALSTTVVL